MLPLASVDARAQAHASWRPPGGTWRTSAAGRIGGCSPAVAAQWRKLGFVLASSRDGLTWHETSPMHHYVRLVPGVDLILCIAEPQGLHL